METLLNISGLHCPSCKALIEEICLEFPGVESAQVSFPDGKTTLTHQSEFDPTDLIKEIQSAGDYKVSQT